MNEERFSFIEDKRILPAANIFSLPLFLLNRSFRGVYRHEITLWRARQLCDPRREGKSNERPLPSSLCSRTRQPPRRCFRSSSHDYIPIA